MPEMRAESFAVEVLDNHTIVISCETAVDPEDFTVRLSKWAARTGGTSKADKAAGEYGDIVIKLRKPMADGAMAERPDMDWCFACQDWFLKGSHADNEPDPTEPASTQIPGTR